jgi:hypothetical protein
MQTQEQTFVEITDVSELLPTHESAHIRWHRAVDISRHPIAAEKDPRALQHNARNASVEHVLTQNFAALMKMLFPHAWVDDGLYLDIASRALRTSEIAEVVSRASARVEAVLGACLLSAPAPAVADALQRLEGEPIFKALLGAAIRHFYDDPRIWSGCGYEGVHGCSGGEQRAGIADATWLPDVEDKE